MEYPKSYLNNLETGVWIPFRTLPKNIGMAGVAYAAAEQILLPEKEIILGSLGATFKIVKVNRNIISIKKEAI